MVKSGNKLLIVVMVIRIIISKLGKAFFFGFGEPLTSHFIITDHNPTVTVLNYQKNSLEKSPAEV